MKFVEWFLFLELILWFYVNWLLQLRFENDDDIDIYGLEFDDDDDDHHHHP